MGVMERIINVTPGQKVTYEFMMGKGEEVANPNAGYFSRMVSRFSGSEIGFNAQAIWTDYQAHQIETLPAKVRSAGKVNGDAAEFWLDGKQIDFAAGDGINIVAVDLKTKAVVSSKTYKAEADDAKLIEDITALPKLTMIMFAVKGSGAEDLGKDAWDALESCGAVLKQGLWQHGYAFIGTRWGQLVSEVRNTDCIAEGQCPCIDLQSELLPRKDVSIESGEQKGEIAVDRAGMVILRWDNSASTFAHKALAKYKLAVE